MNETQPDQLACEWGGTHQETGKSSCAVCEIPMNLNEAIQRFLFYQDTLEFAKNGSMSYRLRDMAIRQYRETIKLFRKYQAVSEEHPEWHLAQEIFRLRAHFDEAAEDCAKEKNAFTRADTTVDYLLPMEWAHKERALADAHGAVFLLYDICCDNVELEVKYRAPPNPSNEWVYPEWELADMDDKLRKALDAIALLPESEGATALDLMNQCHKIYGMIATRPSPHQLPLPIPDQNRRDYLEYTLQEMSEVPHVRAEFIGGKESHAERSGERKATPRKTANRYGADQHWPEQSGSLDGPYTNSG